MLRHRNPLTETIQYRSVCRRNITQTNGKMIS